MTDVTRQIWHWFLHGPDRDANTYEFIVGQLLWWRLWAFNACLASVIIIPALAVNELTALNAAFLSAVYGVLVGTWLVRLSPKHKVIERY